MFEPTAHMEETPKDASMAILKRTAIDPSGRLGSLYDGYRDRIAGQIYLDKKERFCNVEKSVHGGITYGYSDASQNVLQQMSINEQLRLSILLNLTSNRSVAQMLDYPYQINEYSRFLCYTYVDHVQQLDDQVEDIKQRIHPSISSIVATHIITDIQWGIDLFIILQLPSDKDLVQQIDDALGKLVTFLLDDNVDYPLSSDEENVLKEILHTNIYTSVSNLDRFTTVLNVCRYIKDNINNIDKYPIAYSLRSIKELNPNYDGEGVTFIPLSTELNDQLEDYVFQLTTDMKNLERFVSATSSKLLSEDLKQQFFDLKEKFTNEIQRLANIVTDTRSGRRESLTIDEMLNDNEKMTIKNSLDAILQQLNDLIPKEQSQQANNTDADIISEQKRDEIRNSNDHLNNNNVERLKRSRSQFEEDLENTSIDQDDLSNVNKVPDETINVLLLGETGVGKSTFINAFANYLTFNTLEQAEKDQSVVLIPVSFLITTGHDFDERIVKFGDTDELNNEDLLILVNLLHNNLCIIDAPGFGDTRGLTQDDRNMEHILNYIKNLTHLNAICFLLKPNESRLNIFYRSCFMQLTSFLKPNARDNIIFCFTNARSTFYAPGDTGPLLRQMLNSLPINNIPFKKENTFCFDSESFRYLVALKNDISFTELERQEYEMSWRKSVVEANRLIHYICDQLTVQRLENE